MILVLDAEKTKRLYDDLHEHFTYKDGALYRKTKRGGQPIGAKAGSQHDDRGYLRLNFNGKMHYIHRLIYLYHHGYLPKEVDHVDGNPRNNSIENLREVNRTQNNYNQKINCKNKSGVKGVSWHKQLGKWVVRVGVCGEYKHFGCFDDIELAELVANEVRAKYHGDYARCL